jgi:3,4-dihydroxy 2-butanone 4-phosphate synthase/GTP cyclohydrolase II
VDSKFLNALNGFKNGAMLIVVDDHNRENEGDLIMLAEHATPEKTAFMVRHTTGILCVAITEEQAYRLRLPYMVEQNQDLRKTAFTVSVDSASGITTGVSAADRSTTIRALGSAATRHLDLIRPGHIYPLIAHKQGLNMRQGHTEAGIALAELSGAYPAALLAEIVAPDGSMARGETLATFAAEHEIAIISIAEIVEYQSSLALPKKNSAFPHYEFEWVDVQLESGEWSLATYPSLKHREQVVMRFGSAGATPLVRIHSECFTGDVMSSKRCDCGEQLNRSIIAIQEHGYGFIIYLRDHEGRGIGLSEKLKSYILQNQGFDTVDANLELGHPIDARDWSEAVAILKNLNLTSIRLLTNNPLKVLAVLESGIACEQVSLSVGDNKFNEKYLTTKAERLGHVRSK